MGDDDELRVIPSDETGLRDLALKRLKEKREFKIHATAYVLVNILIFVVWLVVAITSGAWFPWFVFPLVGWGVGLGMHAWGVYGQKDVTEDEVQREMDRLRKR